MLRICGTNVVMILAVCFSANFACHSACFAQSPTSAGKIIATVHDQLNGAVTNAEIVLQGNGYKSRKTFTNQSGTAEFAMLPDGDYRVTIKSKGFQNYVNEAITIKNGISVSFEARLNIAPVESNVSVNENDSDSSASENFGGTRTLSQKEIDSLPDNPEDLERTLRLLAGPTVTGEQQSIKINGFAGGKIPPKQAIRQVRINQNVFSAQYDSIGGSGIEIITAAGLENFSGGFAIDGTDYRLNASDPFLGYRAPSQSIYYGGHLQGPLIPKRASFMVDLGYWRNERRSIVNAVVLDSSLHPAEYRKSFPALLKRTEMASRLDFDITEKHKIYVSFQYESRRDENAGIGTLSLPSRSYNGNRTAHTLQIAETAIVNKSIVNQTRFEFVSAKLTQKGLDDGVITEVQDAFSDGGAQINNSNTNRRFEMSNDTTWQMGNYTLYFGGRVRGVSIRDASFSNLSGRYIFSGGVAPILDANNNPVSDAGGNALTASINSLESYRRTLLFRQLGFGDSQIRALGGGASRFIVESGEPNAHVRQFDVGLYIQNSLSLRRDLSLSFGLRYENQTNIDSPLNIAPRIGVVWSPSINQKNESALTSFPRISAGFGVFYQRVGEQLSFDEARFNARSQYIVDDTDVLDLYPVVPSISLLKGFSPPTIRRILDSRIQSPYQTLFNINLEKRLPYGMSVYVSTGFSTTQRALRSRNINAPLAGTYNPDNSNNSSFPLGENVGDVYQNESSGVVKSSFLVAALKVPKLKPADLQINYTFRNTKDNLAFGSGSPFDPYDFSNEFAPSDNEAKHNLSVIAQSRLPFGVRIVNIFSVISGLPYNITIGRDTNGDGLYFERPAFASDLKKAGLIATPFGLIDPNPLLSDRIIPRNYARGTAIFVLNTSIYKIIKFGGKKNQSDEKRYSLNLGIDLKNALNTVNRGNPVGNISSPSFLRSIAYSSRGGLFGVPSPRRISLSMGVTF